MAGRRGVVAPPERRRQLAFRVDMTSIAWWVLVGTAAGALAGFIVGGIGGRVAMLLLRLTSSDAVLGATSDDGFEIGAVSIQTFQLLFLATVLGGMNGVLYAVLRTAIPVRLRLPLWAGFGALAGGATIVHEDGVDFTLISPALLSIVLFVALPGLAAALVVLLVERWHRGGAWPHRRVNAFVVVAAICSAFALVPAALVAAAAYLIGLAGVSERLLRAGRIVVPVGLAGVSLVAALALARESWRILS